LSSFERHRRCRFALNADLTTTAEFGFIFADIKLCSGNYANSVAVTIAIFSIGRPIANNPAVSLSSAIPVRNTGQGKV